MSAQSAVMFCCWSSLNGGCDNDSVMEDSVALVGSADGAAKLDVLPVVSCADTHIILGIVVLSDVLKAFGIDGRERGDLDV